MPQTNPWAWVHLLGARGSHRQRDPGLEGLPWVFRPMTDRSGAAAPADQAELQALGHRLAPVGDTELGVGRRQVALHRGLTYVEASGDVDRKSTRLNSSH